MSEKDAAVLTIRDTATQTSEAIRHCALWLREEADKLDLQGKTSYGELYEATYSYKTP